MSSAGAAMYAQVIETSIRPDRLELLERLVRCELMPALREEPGFSGAMSLVDRDRAATLLVLLWETQADAACPRASVTELPGVSLSPTAVWEVNVRG
jgi:hypothetical protein